MLQYHPNNHNAWSSSSAQVFTPLYYVRLFSRLQATFFTCSLLFTSPAQWPQQERQGRHGVLSKIAPGYALLLRLCVLVLQTAHCAALSTRYPHRFPHPWLDEPKQEVSSLGNDPVAYRYARSKPEEWLLAKMLLEAAGAGIAPRECA